MHDPLYSLAYFSRNRMAGERPELHRQILQILGSARRCNAARGVTGALLFSDDRFAQVLEGRREDVDAVFEALRDDPRHSDVTLLYRHAVAQRSFGAWHMAFGGIAGVSFDPAIDGDGMRDAEGILATVAGQHLLQTLCALVRRGDETRRAAPATP